MQIYSIQEPDRDFGSLLYAGGLNIKLGTIYGTALTHQTRK
jgi:hypothetical protein